MPKRNRCSQCRKDRQKCEPENRDPGVQCRRCYKKNFPCSESYSKHDDPNIQKCIPCRRYKQTCIRDGDWPENSCVRCQKEKRNCSASYIATKDPELRDSGRSSIGTTISQNVTIRDTHDLLQELDFFSYLLSMENDFIHVHWFDKPNIDDGWDIGSIWSSELSNLRGNVRHSFHSFRYEYQAAILSHNANGSYHEAQLLSSALQMVKPELTTTIPDFRNIWHHGTRGRELVLQEMKTAIGLDRRSGLLFAALRKLKYTLCQSGYDWKSQLERNFGNETEISELFLNLNKSTLKRLPALMKGIKLEISTEDPLYLQYFKPWGLSTPLHRACCIRQEGLVQCVLREWPDLINSRNIAGETPLHVAFRLKDNEVARYLISQGADFHLKDEKGRTPLMWACYNKSWQVFTDFRPILPLPIQNEHGIFMLGLEPEIEIDFSLSAFHLVCYHGESALVKKFLEAGVDVNMPDPENVDNSDETNNPSPLIAAVSSRNRETLRLLIESGANLHSTMDYYLANLSGEVRLDAIAFALHINWTVGFILLFDAGAKVDIALDHLMRDVYGVKETHDWDHFDKWLQKLQILSFCCPERIPWTIYFWLMDCSHLDILICHLKLRKSCKIKEQGTRTLLHAAVDSDIEDTEAIIRFLVEEFGIDPDAKAEDGSTALHSAVRRGKTHLVLQLLELNASPRISNHNGETPINLAYLQKRNEILDLLLNESEGNGPYFWV